MGHRRTFHTLATLTIITTLISFVTTYPTAVPNSPDVCSKMTPGHGPRPQRGNPPYEIILNKQKLQGGNNLQIILQGKDGTKFRGFYMQARDQDGSPIGTFLIPDEKEVGAHNCFNQKQNAVHHKNNQDKDSVMVYWKAPQSFDGKVKVLATVLQSFDTYWIDVQAPKLVSISNTTKYFISSSDFLEKRTTQPAKSSKTSRVLNYNPYSPFSPYATLDESNENSTSTEFLLPQASDDSLVTAQGRQLFGFPTFDFHGTSYSPKPPRKSKNVYAPSFEHPHLPFFDHGDKLPLYPHNKFVFPHANSPFDAPKGSLVYNKFGAVKDKHGELFNTPKASLSPFRYPPLQNPHHSHYLTSVPDTNPSPYFSTSSYDQLSYPPHLSQSIQNDKGNHYLINQHYLHNQPLKPNYPKPAIDPSYPNSGYFPKDILTKLTSYIPNIYNALTNNHFFNYNVDNTIESVWKPTKSAVPLKHDLTLPVSAATQMPKYGYLVYNPVRKNPYFVIPAENEDEFVANHLVGRNN